MVGNVFGRFPHIGPTEFNVLRFMIDGIVKVSSRNGCPLVMNCTVVTISEREFSLGLVKTSFMYASYASGISQLN